MSAPDDRLEAAQLTFRSANGQATWDIFQPDEFDIGRDEVYDMLGVLDQTISKHHIRIHCVAYEDDEHRVPPLVYMRVLSSNSALLQRNDIDHASDPMRLTNSYGDVLLSSGDRIQLTRDISAVLTLTADTHTARLDEVQSAEIELFSHKYLITKRVLGIGGFAAVYMAVKNSTGQQFACKIMRLPLRDKDLARFDMPRDQQGSPFEYVRAKIAREYSILTRLSHPNIITLEKVFRTSYNTYMFQELITGGDLMSLLEKNGTLEEAPAAAVVRQLLEAVKYLHANQVVHRDIKPENILLTSWRDGARIVLSDFGQARTAADVDHAAIKSGVFRMYSLVGTPGYAAPEVYSQMRQALQEGSGYSKAVDIWSVGCVTALLFTSQWLPSQKERPNLARFNQQLQDLDNDQVWTKIGHRAQSFVRCCLTIDPGSRPSAVECLQLPWLRHPHYQKDFDDLYERSVADWEPKEVDDKIIEFIDTSNIKVQPEGTPAANEAVHSQHFPVLDPEPKAPSDPADLQTQLARFRAQDGAGINETFETLSPMLPRPPPLSPTFVSRAQRFGQQHLPT